MLHTVLLVAIRDTFRSNIDEKTMACFESLSTSDVIMKLFRHGYLKLVVENIRNFWKIESICYRALDLFDPKLNTNYTLVYGCGLYSLDLVDLLMFAEMNDLVSKLEENMEAAIKALSITTRNTIRKINKKWKEENLTPYQPKGDEYLQGLYSDEIVMCTADFKDHEKRLYAVNVLVGYHNMFNDPEFLKLFKVKDLCVSTLETLFKAITIYDIFSATKPDQKPNRYTLPVCFLLAHQLTTEGVVSDMDMMEILNEQNPSKIRPYTIDPLIKTKMIIFEAIQHRNPSTMLDFIEEFAPKSRVGSIARLVACVDILTKPTSQPSNTAAKCIQKAQKNDWSCLKETIHKVNLFFKNKIGSEFYAVLKNNHFETMFYLYVRYMHDLQPLENKLCEKKENVC